MNNRRDCRILEDELARELEAIRQSLFARDYFNPQRTAPSRYSLEAVADKIGVSKTTIHHWESGHNCPKQLMDYVKWAQALDVSFEDIFVKVIRSALNGEQ